MIEIVIPYAGSADLLREAVLSVLRQDDVEWRLLVVEDGPQDATVGPWLAGLDDCRITHRTHDVNLGIAGNFQQCLELASEAHVVFLGCDDRLLPGYVSCLKAALASYPGTSVVQPGVRVIDSAGRPVSSATDRVKAVLAQRRRRGAVLQGEPLLTSLMRGNWTYFPSLCWDRGAISSIGFRQDLATVLDLALLADLVVTGRSMLVLNEVVFEYRRHALSASSLAAARSDRFVEERRLSDEVAASARALHWQRAARSARSRPSSRLHALMLFPSVLTHRDRRAASTLARHVFGR